MLALDTASLVSSVALASSDTLIGELTLNTRKTHSERLMPYIIDLLHKAEVDKSAVTALAVSLGPGSFTGLRIGLATAKAIAYALQIKIVGVPTLAALAYGCPSPDAILSPLFDAQKGNVYQGLYRWQRGVFTEILPPRVASIEQVIDDAKKQGQTMIMLGEAAQMYREQIVSAGAPLLLAPPHVIMPRAANVALLGIEMLKSGEIHDVMQLEPLYIRRSEAEDLWEKRHGEVQ